jgi:hypothetical protein
MAGANSNIQLTDLDFDTIKNNLKTYLKSQDTFKDYNFDGSGLSVLVDLLAYNTQYNSFYLNMVANEMFLDSAVQRSSVVSHAKLLNYVPKSAIAPTADVKITFSGVSDSSLTLPAYSSFLSEAVDGVNYTFVNTDSITQNAVANTVVFPVVTLKQGVHSSYSYTVNSTTNPSYTFEIPDSSVDTTTLSVVVQNSSTDATQYIYKPSSSILSLDGNSQVYFLQESLSGNYEIYFGDGVIGKKLTDGNVVKINYLSTEASAAAGANNFVLMDNIGSYSFVTVEGLDAATNGSPKESIDSIKYQSTKKQAAQGRAVTKEDYITAIQQNTLGVSFDAVNVWGGEQNDPPVYGQIFICLKPQGGYTLTETQKQRLVQDVIKPISVMTVTPTIVEPDYTYITLDVNVMYDPKKTTLSANQIGTLVSSAVQRFSSNTLNTFESTLSVPQLSSLIQGVDVSIITNEVAIKLQKKFYPNLTTTQTYKLYYGAPLVRSSFASGLGSSPALQYRNPLNLDQIVDGVYIEEIPSTTGGVESISILNPGFGYQYPPKVEILGDGTGASAEAVITTSGTIKKIIITNPGSGYTSVIVKITPVENDSTGQLGAAFATMQGQYGTLRSYYYNTNNVKTIFNSNIGTIDYSNGIVTLNGFNPVQVDNELGHLTITSKPTTTLISSTYNRIITIDPYDSSAIKVNVTAKTQ